MWNGTYWSMLLYKYITPMILLLVTVGSMDLATILLLLIVVKNLSSNNQAEVNLNPKHLHRMATSSFDSFSKWCSIYVWGKSIRKSLNNHQFVLESIWSKICMAHFGFTYALHASSSNMKTSKFNTGNSNSLHESTNWILKVPIFQNN